MSEQIIDQPVLTGLPMFMRRLIGGDELPADLQEAIARQFVHYKAAYGSVSADDLAQLIAAAETKLHEMKERIVDISIQLEAPDYWWQFPQEDRSYKERQARRARAHLIREQNTLMTEIWLLKDLLVARRRDEREALASTRQAREQARQEEERARREQRRQEREQRQAAALAALSDPDHPEREIIAQLASEVALLYRLHDMPRSERKSALLDQAEAFLQRNGAYVER